MASNAEGDNEDYFVTQSYRIRGRPHGRQRERRVCMLEVIFDKREWAQILELFESIFYPINAVLKLIYRRR